MKTIIWDFAVIIILTVFLLILSETKNIDLLIKLPFVTIYAASLLGRFVCYLSNKEKVTVE